jgi:GT2 family glycosyltransferase
MTDVKKVSRIALSAIEIDDTIHEKLERHIGPALSRFHKAHPNRYDLDGIKHIEFNADSSGKGRNPLVSMIIPLYGRIDFMEYQLAEFSNDPWICEFCQNIYVLDDPSKERETLSLARDLSKLFRIPFELLHYDENYGYAVANNIAAGFAKASKLLLLNSDVMPIGAGWLRRMLDIYEELETPGALGPKLLFEDGSIQHAGISFEKSEEFGIWLNEHPGKGLPDLGAEKKGLYEVPAVTAACMMIDRESYESVGGLSENYILGDFEDSDLCLKLIDSGAKNYYTPDVSLVHLERQSQNLFADRGWKSKITLYNGWQHDKRWGGLIEKLMEKYDEE